MVAAKVIDGIDKSQVPPTSAEGSVVAASLKVVGDVINTAMTQLNAARKTTEDPAQKSFYELVFSKLLEAKTATTAPQDPLDAYTKALALLEAVSKQMTNKLGYPNAQPGAMDASALVQLETNKAELEQKKQQWQTEQDDKKRRWAEEDKRWEEEQAEKKHRWVVEDKKWELEMQATIASISGDKERKDKAQEALLTLGAGIASAIKLEPDYSGDEAVGAQAGAPGDGAVDPVPKQWKCQNCGHVINIPPGATEIECNEKEGGCGFIWDIKRK